MKKNTIQDAMTNVVLKMAEHYQEKHQQSYEPSKLSKRIILGRSRSASDTFEESFALAILPFLKDDREIYIDAPMSMLNKSGVGKSETVYPDIIILDRYSQLRGIIELKIDLGWLSDGWSDKRRSFLKTLAKKQLSIKRGKINLKIGKNFQYLIVVLSQVNDHKRWKESFSKKHRGYAFLLLDKNFPHPNDRKNQGLEVYKDLVDDKLFIARCEKIEEIISKM